MESIINQFVNSLPFELHLMDPLVGKYSACGPGTKHKERIKKYLQSGDVTNLFVNKLDAACFDHDKGYAAVRDVAGRKPYPSARWICHGTHCSAASRTASS